MSEITKPVRSPRPLVWIAGAIVALAALAGVGLYGWLRFTTPAPPEVNLSDVEPAVAQAIEAATAKVRQNGRSGAAWGELGQVLLAHEFDGPADVCFVQAEKFDPNQPRWPYYRGLTRATQNPAEALPFLKRAADLCERYDRGNDAPRLVLAETFLQMGAEDDARAQLDAVLSWDPDNGRARYDLGMLALARQDDETAAKQFTAAAADPHTRRKSCVALAAIRERQGDAAGAADYARRAAAPPKDQEWDDPYAEEYLRRQVVHSNRFAEPERLEAAGRLQEALPLWLDLAKDASDGRAQIAAGTALYKMKRYEEAEHCFRTAVASGEEQVEANYFLAIVLYGEGERLEGPGGAGKEAAAAKYREALPLLDKALELKPNYARGCLYRGLVLRRLGRRAEATAALREAVRCKPEWVDAHLRLGETLIEDGQKEEGIAELRRAAALASADDARPREALGKALARPNEPRPYGSGNLSRSLTVAARNVRRPRRREASRRRRPTASSNRRPAETKASSQSTVTRWARSGDRAQTTPTATAAIRL